MDLSKWRLYTHNGCLDGCASAILGMHAGIDPKNIHYLNPGHVDEDLAESPAFLDPSKPILLVDIAPYSDEMANRLAYRGRFVVLDHHKQSERFAGRTGFIISVGNKCCGAELFREWLSQTAGCLEFDAPSFQRFTELVDDHDRWVHHHPFSQDMARFFAFVGQDTFIDDFYDIPERFGSSPALTPNGEHWWQPSERKLLGVVKAQQERRFKRLLERFTVRRRQFQGRDIAVAYIVTDEQNTSELLNDYLLGHPDIDLACQVNLQSGKLSYRGVGRVSIPDLVVPLGGGGHFDAGGCSLPAGLEESVIEMVEGMEG